MIYSELLSNIWIGDIEISSKSSFLKDNNIDIIINCTTCDIKITQDMILVNLSLPDVFDIAYMKINNSKEKILKYIYDNMDTKSILIVSYGDIRISSYIMYLFIEKYGNLSKTNIKNMIQTKNNLISVDY
mgnify:CR=1 FL=1